MISVGIDYNCVFVCICSVIGANGVGVRCLARWEILIRGEMGSCVNINDMCELILNDDCE